MNPNPRLSYSPAAPAAPPRGEITSIIYRVPSLSESGTMRTVSVDPIDGRLTCTCPARRQCWHEKTVAAGMAGKPRVRVTVRPRPTAVTPPAPAPRLSAADLYGTDDDRDALARRLAELRQAVR